MKPPTDLDQTEPFITADNLTDLYEAMTSAHVELMQLGHSGYMVCRCPLGIQIQRMTEHYYHDIWNITRRRARSAAQKAAWKRRKEKQKGESL